MDDAACVAVGIRSVCRNCGTAVQYDRRPRTGLRWTHCASNEVYCPGSDLADPLGSVNVTVDWPDDFEGNDHG